jgi:hypothetical protein
MSGAVVWIERKGALERGFGAHLQCWILVLAQHAIETAAFGPGRRKRRIERKALIEERSCLVPAARFHAKLHPPQVEIKALRTGRANVRLPLAVARKERQRCHNALSKLVMQIENRIARDLCRLSPERVPGRHRNKLRAYPKPIARSQQRSRQYHVSRQLAGNEVEVRYTGVPC